MIITYYKGKQNLMEQFMELLPTIIAASLVVGGGTFAFVRWLFAREERRREAREAERDNLATVKRETEEKIWVRANETIDRLREEVHLLRCDLEESVRLNQVFRQEISDLQGEVKTLTKLLEEASI